MKEMNENYEESKSLVIEGRNAVLEALRSGKPMDKLYVLDGCQDGPIRTIVREAKKHDVILQFVTKERLNQLSETGKISTQQMQSQQSLILLNMLIQQPRQKVQRNMQRHFMTCL